MADHKLETCSGSLDRALWSVFAGLIFSITFFAFYLIAFQRLPTGRAVSPIVLWHYIIPLAAFLTGFIFWWLLVCKASLITLKRGVLAGVLTGIASHITLSYLALLFSPFYMVPGTPTEQLLRFPQSLWFGIRFSWLSVTIAGWITIPGGGLVGVILAYLQNKTLSAQKKSFVHYKKILIFLIAVILLLTIFIHSDGPYRGRVIETGTEKPIEGAVVAVDWKIKITSNLRVYCDMKETVTDKNGEFELPKGWCINHSFAKISKPSIVVFKPGYLGYPPLKTYMDAYRRPYMLNGGIDRFFEDSQHYNVIELGQPYTEMERTSTLRNATIFFSHTGAPMRLPILFDITREESKALGVNLKKAKK